MRTVEIPRDEWPGFLDSFSRQHDGWLVAIEVLGADIGAQPELVDLPLVGIANDRPDVGDETLSIFVGRSRAQHITHTVERPSHLRLEQTDTGADLALQIESELGETTILRFRSAANPETLDGIVRGRDA